MRILVLIDDLRGGGTENVLEFVGLGKACELCARGLDMHTQLMKAMRDRLHGLLSKWPDLRLNGHPDRRLPNTLSVAFPGHRGEEILKALPRLCASTGAACHDRSVTISHVLAAMGVPPEVAQGTIRLSLGRMTTLDDIEEALELFSSLQS